MSVPGEARVLGTLPSIAVLIVQGREVKNGYSEMTSNGAKLEQKLVCNLHL